VIHRFRRTLSGLSAALALVAAPLGAQTVRGVLVDEAARPVPGALVVLVDSGGVGSGGAVTDAQGRFTLAAAAAGRYNVRAERTGYRTAEAGVELAAGQTVEVRLTTGVRAFVLPTVDVVGQSRCTVRPGRGMAAYALWDEARKALASTAVLQDAERVRYTVRTYRRHISFGGRTRRRNDDPRRVTGRPFQTLAPAELASGGYVRTEADSAVFYGPDAHVLLSDEFLDTHCLYVDERQADRRTVALAFEPVRRDGIADIRGVLRLGRATGELQSVEYEYTEAPGATGSSRARGSVEFERLQNGAWVITRWHIRTTNFSRGTLWSDRGRQTERITDIYESGGEVTQVERMPEG